MSPLPPAGAAGGAAATGRAHADQGILRRLPLGVVLVALALIVLGKTFVAEPMSIPSDSMAPTLRPGDQVLVDKVAYRGAAMPHRGDLAVFHDPRTDEILLKRVVAVGGDTVGLEDGRLVVNGRRPVEPYADQKAIDSVYFGPVTVRQGSFFVLGDNRANSQDSRSFGAVPTSTLIGRARARVWPPSRWATTR
ncbi:MAG: signal peptidase [Solirubrobacteraceae bacterium]|nr:signal peptidase [Solirubrobacteraceae bacterium]